MAGVALFFNPQKKEAVEFAKKLADFLKTQKHSLKIKSDQAAIINKKQFSASEDNLLKGADFLFAVGGDGTMLKAARLTSLKNVPIIGFSLGGLGFLTEIEKINFRTSLEKIFQGKYEIDSRMMLNIRLLRNNKIHFESEALNETVIKSIPPRIMHIPTSIDGQLIITYPADGLIIATPTGSTAYSLAAGGPLAHSNLKCIILTPICSHTLTARALVIPSATEVKICLEKNVKEKEVVLAIDGQEHHYLKSGDIVLVTESNKTTKFIRLESFDFFKKLRNKLGWSG
jgi:NAD+ kinase